MKRTGPTNTQLQSLIVELKKAAAIQEVPLFGRLAEDLERPTRQRRIVNLTRIDANTEDSEVIVVPGKVLAGGDLTHKVDVYAFSFSEGAKEKILSTKGNCHSINDLVSKFPKGKSIRILG